MLMRLYNKLFTINWVNMSILENTMSSLLSMALASLTKPYKKYQASYFLVSNSNYNLQTVLFCLGLTEIKHAMSNRSFQHERFFHGPL